MVWVNFKAASSLYPCTMNVKIDFFSINCLLWATLFVVSFPLSGQVSRHFERISSEDGLQQSIVYSIAQDSFDNIWAGTEEGVVRYNSRETFLYNKYKGFSGHTRNRTSKIFIDSQQQIWVGTEEGVSRYNPVADRFDPVKTAVNSGPILVKQITEDDHGNIWIGGFNGIWVYHVDTDASKEGLIQVSRELNVLSLYCDRDRVIAGSDRGLYVFEAASAVLRPIGFEEEVDKLAITAIHRVGTEFWLGTRDKGLFKADDSLTKLESVPLPLGSNRAYPINRILVDAENHIFLATDGAGLLYLDEEGKLLDRHKNDPNLVNSISSDGIYDVLLDAEDRLWIATYGGGINTFDLSENTFQTVRHRLNDSGSLSHNFTRAILEDSEGNIWFGTKEGISIWNRKQGTWRHLASLAGTEAESDIVMALAEQGDYIWAGTYGRGAFRIDKRDFSVLHYSKDSPEERRIGLMRIYAARVDSAGNCWLGGIEEGLYRISPDGKMAVYPLSQIRHITESRNDRMLVSGRFGVQRIAGDSIVDIATLKAGQNGLSYTTISCLYEDENGSLVLGTNGNGLIFHNIETGKNSFLDPNKNLPSDIVQGILRDEWGTFWVSTTRGLVRINLTGQDTLLSVFTQRDGIAGDEFNYGSYTRLSDGAFAFGGVNGVTLFYPGAIDELRQVPKVVLEGLELLHTRGEEAGRQLPVNINRVNEITLKYYEDALGIKFAGVLHQNPDQVVYSWKMDGLNERWSEPGKEDQINFTNLKPGTYRFRVKAANRDGIWGEERQLAITITPPWWQTRLAYLVYVLFAISLFAGIAYLAGIFIRKRNADEQIAFFRNITHELKTPLSILLSTLENASHVNDEGKQASLKIKTTIKRLSTLFEQLLEFNKISGNAGRSTEISKLHLPTYLTNVLVSFQPLLEEAGLKVALTNTCRKEIFYYDKEVLDKILFNLISNAVKYSRKGGTIRIAVSEPVEGKLELRISDEGIGIPRDQQKFILKRYYRGRNAINSQLPGTGLGLMIVKSLVERDRGTIQFESFENLGTTFSVLLLDQRKFYAKAIVTATSLGKTEFRDKVAEFSDAKILVVEDNDELRKIMVDEISTYFQVFEASNGKEGLEITREKWPDLIITDLIMPEMDGMELCRQLQDDINLNHIPVFMVTVLSNRDYELESIETGVTAYIEKPFDFNVLLARISANLTWQKKLRERYRHHADVETAEIFKNKRDAAFLQNLESFILEKVSQENLSVHDLCRHLGMSRTALYMKLKNMVDLSPQNFIIHTRLKFARKLFVEKNYNVKEVAYLAGFSNPKYFSTSFKKLFGYTPLEFLKSLEA